MKIFARASAGTDLLRLVLCAILFTHGAYRFYEGSSPILGQILEEEGFPAGSGTLLAYAVNLVETLGSALLALGIFTLPVCAALTIIYTTGIILFHRHNGFFVVGPGTGGWEYSALLITCLLTTAWEELKQKIPVR
ncbi:MULTISPECIES: DoxX family protein [unclassified Duganella]|uniref:DoxX family protein n=1 Tax=unclassified Duganella TaxID=2636909 RepID=UPI000E355710|nr:MULTISPECIES: DoxX family protein [unclassified Duganella]RFP14745.1 DoxX family protein [Duganella sp. BJB475]RFP31094.1 DoxX family protein [Duganella sp. BJB476]